MLRLRSRQLEVLPLNEVAEAAEVVVDEVTEEVLVGHLLLLRNKRWKS
jgi:hypothetical protein